MHGGFRASPELGASHGKEVSNAINHPSCSEHDSIYSQSTEGVPCLIASETTSSTASESASLPPTSHPDSTTKGGRELTTSTIATAEWINDQTYRPENKPIREARFSPAEMSASLSTETLPTLLDQTLYTFAGQIQDTCYCPEGSITVSSFQGINTASGYQMESQLPDPLQYSRQIPLQRLCAQREYLLTKQMLTWLF
jgi:hypothetical protein